MDVKKFDQPPKHRRLLSHKMHLPNGHRLFKRMPLVLAVALVGRRLRYHPAATVPLSAPHNLSSVHLCLVVRDQPTMLRSKMPPQLPPLPQ